MSHQSVRPLLKCQSVANIAFILACDTQSAVEQVLVILDGLSWSHSIPWVIASSIALLGWLLPLYPSLHSVYVSKSILSTSAFWAMQWLTGITDASHVWICPSFTHASFHRLLWAHISPDVQINWWLFSGYTRESYWAINIWILDVAEVSSANCKMTRAAWTHVVMLSMLSNLMLTNPCILSLNQFLTINKIAKILANRFL